MFGIHLSCIDDITLKHLEFEIELLCSLLLIGKNYIHNYILFFLHKYLIECKDIKANHSIVYNHPRSHCEPKSIREKSI